MKPKHFAALTLVALVLLLTACGGTASGTRRDDPGSGSGGAGGSITAVNHVVILMQENRSFDSYFGKMTDYRKKNGIPINSSDGKIRDFSDCKGNCFNYSPSDPTTKIEPYHSGSVCTENLSPDWAESAKMRDLEETGTLKNDGFVNVAHGLSQYLELTDATGRRAMGYFDETDLNYYYAIASNFALSDMMFSPVPSNTTPNRLYFHAGTSQGHAHTPASQLTAKTIWQALDEKGVSWKIYVTDYEPGNFLTYLEFFTYSNDPAVRAKFRPLTEYFTDVQNGTLPAVAFIETGMRSGRDEHPSNKEGPGGAVHTINIQNGAKFSSELINALMKSPSWKDSVFFWIFDEAGGPYDHVLPISVPSPDGIAPVDLDPTKDRAGDFTVTGFRLPNFIVSPFARKNYVSHTPMDFTAILRFIGKRWDVGPLTKRDAAMPDMTEFFDFRNGGPWATPPSLPAQDMSKTCDFNLQ